MARHTSLYQAPRSPLIQGRTRWERPLWQPWLAGAGLGLVALAGWWLADTLRGVPAPPASSIAWLVVGVVAGSGLGVGLAKTWGWRRRWLVAALASIAGMAIATVVLAVSAGSGLPGR